MVTQASLFGAHLDPKAGGKSRSKSLSSESGRRRDVSNNGESDSS